MIEYNLPAEEYHISPGISKSGLDKIAISPAHYLAGKERPQKPSEELLIGQATHTLILEPEKFDGEFIVAPSNLDKRTTAGKAAALELEESGKKVLSADQFDKIEGMAKSVRSNGLASELISNGHAEVSANTVIEEVMVRGRCDFLRSDGCLVDLKTTRSAHPKQFSKSIAEFRYHVQAAIYTDIFQANGIYVPDFTFIAVEKFYPYAVGIYQVDEDAIDHGRRLYLRDLSVYRECLQSKIWPSYPEEIVTLRLPSWA
jgi:exodeoxyribonuclease VIII